MLAALPKPKKSGAAAARGGDSSSAGPRGGGPCRGSPGATAYRGNMSDGRRFVVCAVALPRRSIIPACEIVTHVVLPRIAGRLLPTG